MEADFVIRWQGITYEARGQELCLRRGGTWLATFSLNPVIEGDPTTIGTWRKVADNHFQSELDRGGRIHVALREGHVAYWMDTDIVEFNKLVYFPNTTICGQQWRTFSCDNTDGEWDVRQQVEVPIATAYTPFSIDEDEGLGTTDPGDAPQTWIWNVAARLCTLRIDKRWLGLSIPGPVPVGVTRFTMNRKRFSITFEVLRSTCPDWGMPVVYFVANLDDPYDLLDEHRLISDRLGLTVKRSDDNPSWWSNGNFHYYDELLCYMHDRGHSKADPSKKLTTKLFLSWLRQAKESLRIQDLNTTFEQGCYRLYGDYTPTDDLGGTEGMRQMVDSLREEGTHCAYYIHPFYVNTKLPIYDKRPDIFCKPKNREFRLQYALEFGDTESPEFAAIDWTHPDGRAYILKWVEFILSDAPGCLNCDILRSNNWQSPDTRLYDFHDPDWGIGDLMTMKVQKLLYEKAKRTKPHCMVSKVSFADCYMQPYADMNLIGEDWSGQMTNWYRRGRIATRLIHDVLQSTVAHFLTQTKSYEYYMGMSSWSFPDTPIVDHVIHTRMIYLDFPEKGFRRRRAGYQVYMNAPICITDRSWVDWDGQQATQWRKRTQGLLRGWYAALAITHRCLASYSEEQCLVATSESREVVIPLPPGARLKTVEMIPHEGEARTWDYELITTDEGQGVEMFLEDCGFEPMYYRIAYEIAPLPAS